MRCTRLTDLSLASLFIVLAVIVSACDNGAAASSATSPTTSSTDILTGTVSPPVEGVLQNSFNTFVVNASGGSVTVTLTSAVESLPDGTLLTTVTMGLGVGTVTNGTCTIYSSAFTTAQGSSSPQISGTLSAGTYCVQVSDVTNQLGPVSYGVAVSHF